MHTFVIFTSLLAAHALAAPSTTRHKKYFGVAVDLITYEDSGRPTVEPIPATLNKLINLTGVSVSTLKIAPGGGSNVDPATVSCRAYKDVNGIEPASNPFGLSKPAYLSTNTVEISSLLCYVDLDLSS